MIITNQKLSTSTKDNSKVCFVIMPFNEKFDEVFEYAIMPAVKGRGYNCIRMDKALGTGNLIHEMIHNIYRADLIIADLTGKSANVFYELGVAHSVTQYNNTIMIAENNEEIPFDIAVYKIIMYTRSIKGINTLKEVLNDEIHFIETEECVTTNPIQDYLISNNFYKRGEFVQNQKHKNPTNTVFNKLNISIIRLSILSLLHGLPKESFGLRIGNICQILGVKKRKLVVIVLKEMEIDGLIIKIKQDKSTFWYISDLGKAMLVKLEKVIQTKIELTVKT